MDTMVWHLWLRCYAFARERVGWLSLHTWAAGQPRWLPLGLTTRWLLCRGNAASGVH